MGEQIIKNVKVVLDGVDLSGDMNEFSINYGADMLDNTVFGQNSRRRFPGLKLTEISGGGFFNSSGGAAGRTNDPTVQPKIGAGSSDVVTICPNGFGTTGNEAYFTKVAAAEYNVVGSIGDMLAFNLVAMGHGELVRGKVLEATSNYSTENSAIQLLRQAATTDMHFYAAVQVLRMSTGANITLDFNRTTTTDMSSAKSTQFSITLTSDAIRTGRWSATKIDATSTGYSYQITVGNAGSSGPGKGGYIVATIGYKRGGTRANG